MNAHASFRIRSPEVETIQDWTNLDADVLQALAAACVLVAQADGWVTPAERRQTLARMRRGPVVTRFGHDEVAHAFETFNQQLEYDLDLGIEVAEAAVRRISDRLEAAHLVLETACAVAEADGGLDAEEREVILDLCDMVGLDPADFEMVIPAVRRL
jgi:tellurite resistance protein TerB